MTDEDFDLYMHWQLNPWFRVRVCLQWAFRILGAFVLLGVCLAIGFKIVSAIF
jgi:hypothetical protein